MRSSGALWQLVAKTIFATCGSKKLLATKKSWWRETNLVAFRHHEIKFKNFGGKGAG